MIAPIERRGDDDLSAVGRCPTRPDADRLRDRRAGQRADEVRRRRQQDRVLGPEGPRRDRRRDRVRGVVEAVDVVEDDGEARGPRAAGASRLRARCGSASRCTRAVGTAAPRRATARRSGTSAAILRPCACPSSSSPRSATTPPTPRCRRTACSLRAGYVRQLGSGIYSLLPLGKRVNDRVEQIIREEQDRDRRPGDGDAGRPPGRRLAGERPLRRDRAGAGPLQGPQRARHGPRDDPRGGRRDPAGRHRQVVPPAPDAGLPLPDQVARRAALTRRADPRPRVRHEGRLQLRPRRRRAGRELLGAARRVRPDLRAARARDHRGRRRTSG